MIPLKDDPVAENYTPPPHMRWHVSLTQVGELLSTNNAVYAMPHETAAAAFMAALEEHVGRHPDARINEDFAFTIRPIHREGA